MEENGWEGVWSVDCWKGGLVVSVMEWSGVGVGMEFLMGSIEVGVGMNERCRYWK